MPDRNSRHELQKKHDFIVALCICFTLIISIIVLFVIIGEIAFTNRTPIDWLRHKESVETLKDIGNKYVLSINTFKELEGRYPQTLQEAGIVPIETYFGYFEYEVDHNSTSFRLSIGQFMIDGFRLIYQPNSGWILDS